MLLAVDVGNRRVAFGLFHESVDANAATAPEAVFRAAAEPGRTADEYAVILAGLLARHAPAACVTGAIVASIQPTLTRTVETALRQLFPDAPILTVGAGLRSGLVIRTDTPAELGADLVANAAGALLEFRPPFLILDCDTVTTLSAVGGSAQAPAFLGCCILPGPSVSAAAIDERAALVGEVALARPAHAIGTNTAESVRAGILLGHAAAAEGLAARFAAEIGVPTLPMIATGEEAPLILPYLTHPPRCDAELSLKGLCRLFALNAKSAHPPKQGGKTDGKA